MSLLAPPDPGWTARAEALARERLGRGPDGEVTACHICSTLVPGLPAIPVIDVMPVFADARKMANAHDVVECMVCEWPGSHGLPGRGNARRDDTRTGAREVQAHCYPKGDADIARHLTFRDTLPIRPTLRGASTREKARRARLYRGVGTAYQTRKAHRIDRPETAALARR